ncbi:MAG: acyltransferase family protein [Bacteroidetes bacterium]|nr:acyltransferase family protein [Bacteroidota bacterium]
MLTTDRRFDIDWVRVIAIGLLVIYHTAIGFQPWGRMIGFITTEESWVPLWIPMMLLNVWRIPLLFFVSGMGVYFALQRRSWKQLIGERTLRIFVPYVFGIFCIVPIHLLLLRNYYHIDLIYTYDAGHLWFLGNIFVYVLIFTPLFSYLRRNENTPPVQRLKKFIGTPLFLLVVIAAFVAEVLIVKPMPYELYATTRHGFVIGLLAFFFGFCFVLGGDGFSTLITKGRWLFLLGSAALFLWRLMGPALNTPSPMYMVAVESCGWILSVLAFARLYLNHTNKVLRYLTPAAYPVYLFHMIFLYLGATLLFPLKMPAAVQYVLTVLFTLGGSIAAYEVVRRIKWIRALFGIPL